MRARELHEVFVAHDTDHNGSLDLKARHMGAEAIWHFHTPHVCFAWGIADEIYTGA